MPEVNEVYKCEVCGNVVEMIIASAPMLVCCGKEMTLMKEKTEDEGQEKHLPVIEREGNKIKVKVGSVPHPMEENHFIQMIELYDGESLIASVRLSPGEEPVAVFCQEKIENPRARELCNIHGLWKSS